MQCSSAEGEPSYMALLRRAGAPIRATRTRGRGAVAAASMQCWRGVLPEQGSRRHEPHHHTHHFVAADGMHALSPACRWSSSFLIWQNEDDYFVIVIDYRRQRLATRHDGEGSCR
jgi:hypothetical protein